MRLRSQWMVIGILAAGLSSPAPAQVSPAEVKGPRLKQAEQTYFQQLIDLNHAISQIDFPFSFVLSRYAGLDPKQQTGADRRGLEFITFKNRTVLKISGNYNAAFSAQALTENQRADRVVDDVIVPILTLLPRYFTPQSDFDGFGFEISYHVRTNTRSYTYEGAQVLTIVFDRADAFKYARDQSVDARQEILDASQVYLDGKSFGLMLGQRDAAPANEEEREARRGHESASATVAAAAAPPPAVAGSGPTRTAVSQAPAVSPASPPPAAPPAPAAANPPTATNTSSAPAVTQPKTGSPGAPTQADADALQTRLQAQLQALNEEGRAHAGFVDYAPPSFAVFRDQIYLQLTLRNPNAFDKNATSIYKRAAQSFDLFLAPHLKALLAETPSDPAIAGLDVTVLSEFSANASSSSEAIEYACPIGPLRQFANADITSQDLINQSIVLVNGVRIALNLSQVE